MSEARAHAEAELAALKPIKVDCSSLGFGQKFVLRTTPAQVDAIRAKGELTMAQQTAYVWCDANSALLYDAESAADVALLGRYPAALLGKLLTSSRADTPQKDGAVKDPGNSTTASE